MLVLAVPGGTGGWHREDRRPLFVLRCKLPGYWRDRIEQDTDQKGIGRGPSRSWWERGALVVDDAGPALIDADGNRVPVPVPAGGGRLIRMAVTGLPPKQRPNLLAPARRPPRPGQPTRGPRKPAETPMPVIHLHFICGPGGQVIARLPGDEEGFDPAGLAAFAAACGMAYERSTQKSMKEYAGLHSSLDLRSCVDDAAYRSSRAARVKHRLGVAGRRSPYDEPYRSRNPVTTPPYDVTDIDGS
jgi:hypothetical protein